MQNNCFKARILNGGNIAPEGTKFVFVLFGLAEVGKEKSTPFMYKAQMYIQ